jgi:hypothetical protein
MKNKIEPKSKRVFTQLISCGQKYEIFDELETNLFAFDTNILDG